MLFRVLGSGLLIVALALGAVLANAQSPPAARTATLQPGDMAPDFNLKDQEGKLVKLSDFRGKQNVVLAFYPMAFTGG
jgi:cytochrome oxidase Cu insertion factor (SCO1/SenC/PrrC family)